REVAQLQQCFAHAQQGQRQVVLVSGEPGIGKTTLVNQFVARLTDSGSVWIGRGQCIEPYGQGEAYLPLLEALWRLHREPGGDRLRAVLHQHAPTWLAQLPALVDVAERMALQRQVAEATQECMLRELCEVLDVLTAEQPLLLVLEDLHWSDTATLAWVTAVARRPEPARLLIIGTYRPTNVVGQAYPLRGLVQELRVHRLCREVRLKLLHTDDVTAYVRQRLGDEVATTEVALRFYRRTEGNPLFLAASLDALIEQGVVVEADGRWVLRGDLAALDASVPEDLQQLITKQVEALGAEGQELLAVASVSGVTFTTAEVAEGCRQELDATEARCAQLAQHGQLIEEDIFVEWPDGTLTMRYRFRHALYQQVLYTRLSMGQKVRLHRRIGERTEAAYRGHEIEVANTLAVHFERGRTHGKAVRYHQLAAEQALQRSAYHEALRHCQGGIALLSALPDTADRAQQELALRLLLNTVLAITRGFAAPELTDNLPRAQELCQYVTDPDRLVPALVGLSRFALFRADRATAEAVGEQMQQLLPHVQDTALAVQLCAPLGTCAFYCGRLSRARDHYEQVLAHRDLFDRRTWPLFFGGDPVVVALVYSGWCHWLAGWPDEAWCRVAQGLARAEEIAHPFMITAALFSVTLVQLWRGDLSAAQHSAQRLVTLASEQGFSLHRWLGTLVQGCISIQGGEVEVGVASITAALPQYHSTGTRLGLPFFLASLAHGYAQLHEAEKSEATLTEALHLTATTLDQFWEAELHRLKGELTLAPSSVQSLESRPIHRRAAKITDPQPLTPSRQTAAEACFRQAIDVARQQGAKSLELRATMSLARLWQQQGKRGEGHQMLLSCYDWFTEGWDTTDLQDAKALLAELS
ncbi:MAG: AAA family ATPase, partial [Deltaproteobacteria bacterium]|nr:AAA family ATPase [Deltaproteobacteria bacterium]